MIWSLPARGAWIEITTGSRISGIRKSLPARGAWIEIAFAARASRNTAVAPRKGSVD